MRNLPLAIGISAVVHAVVVARLVAPRSPAPHGAGAAPAVTPIEIATVARRAALTAPPLDVVLLDEVTRAAPRQAAPERALAAGPRAPARPPRPTGEAVASRPPSSGATGGNDAAGASGETAPRLPGGTSLLAMRRGQAPSPALPFGRWDDLDHAPRGTAPERDRTSGLLHESGGGSYRSDQGVFTAKVAPDGSVKLTDRRNLDVRVALPTPRALGRSLARWYESDKGRFGAEGEAAAARQLQVSSSSRADPEDPAKGQAGDRTTTVVAPVLAGGFDVSDWLMRSHGQDPYAHRKLAFLDATRDERAELGRRHRAAELARSGEIMRRNLHALWARTQDLRARKQGLFELWDDCAETGDAAVVAAGDAARRLVIGFIRSHLPAGSADAFTPAEIAALARTRKSRVAFRPYE